MMKIYKIQIVLSLFIIIFGGGYRFCLAETNTLPDMMIGQTTVTDSEGHVSYGGMTGNYAVLNSDIQSSYGFTKSSLMLGGLANSCLQSTSTTPLLCFYLGTGIDGSGSAGLNKLMVSRTKIDTGSGLRAIYELPALFFGGVNIIGDAVMPNFSNFAFWGKNLAKSAFPAGIQPNNGVSWALNDYAINNSSQSFWGEDTVGELGKFNAKIQVLADSAAKINESLLRPLSADLSLYLQSSNESPSIDDGTAEEINAKYPEGKVWFINDDVNIPAGKTLTYRGIGTIIIKGNLTVGSGTKIVPNNEQDDKLGIIVDNNNNCTFEGNNNIQAMMFCKGTLSASGDSIDFKGSFIARAFSLLKQNINFYYDYNTGDKVPPGFKYLNMPSAKEVGNN